MKTMTFILLTVLLSLSSLKATETNTECLTKIEQSVCYLKKKQPQFISNHTCLEKDLKKEVKILKKAYMSYPSFLKKEMCSLKKIFIFEELNTTAFSYPDFEEETGGFLGLKLDAFKTDLTISKFVTLKDNLNFKNQEENTHSFQFVSENKDDHQALFYILIHELGHLMDFSYGVTSQDWMYNSTTSWSELSWKYWGSALPAQSFKNIKKLCFYNCKEENKIESDELEEMYRGLMNSNFISFYSTVNPKEDFAESFAYYILIKELDFKIDLIGFNGIAFDLSQKIFSSSYNEKYLFMEDFIKMLKK